MKVSGLFALAGAALIAGQHFWAPSDAVPMPWHFAPLMVGLLALIAAAAIGLGRGNRLYRVAVTVGSAALVVIGVAILVNLGPFYPTPHPPDPPPNEIVFWVGLALAALSGLLGAVAIVIDRRLRPRDNQ